MYNMTIPKGTGIQNKLQTKHRKKQMESEVIQSMREKQINHQKQKTRNRQRSSQSINQGRGRISNLSAKKQVVTLQKVAMRKIVNMQNTQDSIQTISQMMR